MVNGGFGLKNPFFRPGLKSAGESAERTPELDLKGTFRSVPFSSVLFLSIPQR